MRFKKEVLEWLDKVSDRNALSHYQNNLEDMPKTKKAELRRKGYLNRKRKNRRVELTEKGIALINKEIQPSTY